MRTAKKSAKIVTMTAAVSAMCATMGLNAEQTAAALAAHEDMRGEFPRAIIIDMNPWGGGLIA